MRYSYAWDVVPDFLLNGDEARDRWACAYVRVEAVPRAYSWGKPGMTLAIGLVADPGNDITTEEVPELPVVLRRGMTMEDPNATGEDVPRHVSRFYRGRVTWVEIDELAVPCQRIFALDTRRGRFTWQSVTGLIIGAIGIGVFAFSYRRCQKLRPSV